MVRAVINGDILHLMIASLFERGDSTGHNCSRLLSRDAAPAICFVDRLSHIEWISSDSSRGHKGDVPKVWQRKYTRQGNLREEKVHLGAFLAYSSHRGTRSSPRRSSSSSCRIWFFSDTHGPIPVLVGFHPGYSHRTSGGGTGAEE